MTKKGELVYRKTVDKVMLEVTRRFRDRMENIPARWSGILAAEHNQGTIFAILTKAIHDALMELSDDKPQ